MTGNICASRSVMSPARRPRKRMREKVYAAAAPMNTLANAPTPQMIRVFLYQAQYGRSSKSSVKLDRLMSLGSRSVVLRVPDGLSAAETMKTSGKSAQIKATTPSAYFHHKWARRFSPTGWATVGASTSVAAMLPVMSVHLFQGLGLTEPDPGEDRHDHEDEDGDGSRVAEVGVRAGEGESIRVGDEQVRRSDGTLVVLERPAFGHEEDQAEVVEVERERGDE